MIENWREMAALVASGFTIADAAESIGVSSATGYRTSAEAEFKAEVHRVRAEKVESIVGKLSDAADCAIVALSECATSAEKDSDRIAAAKAVLSLIIPLTENLEFRKRLDDIERKAAEEAEGSRGELPSAARSA